MLLLVLTKLTASESSRGVLNNNAEVYLPTNLIPIAYDLQTHLSMVSKPSFFSGIHISERGLKEGLVTRREGNRTL